MHRESKPHFRISHDGCVLSANPASRPLLADWRVTEGDSVPEPWRTRIVDTLASGHAMLPLLTVGQHQYRLCVVPRTDAIEVFAELSASMAELTADFLSTMGHELKTPLNVVVGMVELALGSSLRADQREWLEAAQTNANLLKERIGGLIEHRAGPAEPVEPLRMLRLGPLQPSAEPQPTTRVLLVEDNPDNQLVMRAQLERAGHFVVVLDRGETAAGAVVAGRFDVVLMDVDLPGIDGLESTRRIREAESEHGLTPMPILAVTAHSARRIRKACHDAGMDDIVPKPVSGAVLLAAVERWTRGRPLILIADDGEASRRLSLRYLGAEPWLKVVEAVNGREVLDILARQRVSVLLLDMEMPVMDGFETAAAIRALPGFAELPIIAVTAHESDGERDRAITAGCSGFLVKPLHRAVLLEAIASHLQSRDDPEASAQSEVVWLDPDVADLVPGYLAARREDVHAIRAHTKAGDFETVGRIAHRLKGSGAAYGFKPITDLGRSLGEAAHTCDIGGVERVVDQLHRYLEGLEVRYRNG